MFFIIVNLLIPFFFLLGASVRERAKNHRSTTSDWNAKIREQRIHQIQQSSQYYDGECKTDACVNVPKLNQFAMMTHRNEVLSIT